MEDENLKPVKFGFKSVELGRKQNLVNQIFSNVAQKYDLANDVISFGSHRFWKKQFCSQVHNLDAKILDVASGTGDIALQMKSRGKEQGKNPHIVLCDINCDMLKIAKSKAINKNMFRGFDYVVANAENLPFLDNSFDYYTIAFGMRNIPRIEKALKEAYRVLKPMGKFLCLEFSKISNQNLEELYKFYSFSILPQIGKIITGNKEAYDYLVESIGMFPDQETFRNMICDVGFKNVVYQNLTLGVAAIHSGYKLS
jgi:demethylmenaquinone methyltransferase/2-methoxy-6-polyprenyl-1,4-benzoquinol methylase